MTHPTLIRTIADVHIAKTLTGAVRGAWGVITWDDIDDTTPSAGEVPSPWLRPDLSWILHGYFFSLSIAGTGSMGSATALGPGEHQISQAMRKLPDPRGVMFVIHNASSSAGTVEYQAGVRCLLKE